LPNTCPPPPRTSDLHRTVPLNPPFLFAMLSAELRLKRTTAVASAEWFERGGLSFKDINRIDGTRALAPSGAVRGAVRLAPLEQQPFAYDFFNRNYNLLETSATHSKQTTAPRSNRNKNRLSPFAFRTRILPDPAPITSPSRTSLRCLGIRHSPRITPFLIADPRLEFRLTTRKINHLNFSNRHKIALSLIVWKSLGVLGVSAVNLSGVPGLKLPHPQETKMPLLPSKSPRALAFKGVYTRGRFLGRYL
jgi:hypothetical protein